jgi:hypothetical protein
MTKEEQEQVQTQIPCGMTKEEQEQVQTQIPCGNDKRRARATTNAKVAKVRRKGRNVGQAL